MPAEKVDAALCFLKDEDSQPRSLKSLGHVQVSDETLRKAARQFVSFAEVRDPLQLPAQRWLPEQSAPQKRDRKLCVSERCPFVEKCFGAPSDTLF